MSYEIIREPFMLQETVSMLYKFVNGHTASGLIKQWKWSADDKRIKRMNRMQEIMDEVCAGLDPHDPELRRLFGHVESGSEDVCLAQIMTYSFCTLKKPGFRDCVEEICGIWKQLQEQGYWIQPESMASLAFSNEPEHPGSLLRQIRALNYPAEFRLELCDVLENFDESMHRLAELIEPLSDHLEEIYRKDTWLFDELWTYWQRNFQKVPPLEMLEEFGLENKGQKTGEKTWVAFCLMNTHLLTYAMANQSPVCADHNLLLIGSCISPQSTIKRSGKDLDGISAILKCLSDRKRLEILQRLSQSRSYGQEIAEATGMDPGNLSRNLTMLHSYGFLRQERETLRTYYQTDQEAVHRFLVQVEREIFK